MDENNLVVSLFLYKKKVNSKNNFVISRFYSYCMSLELVCVYFVFSNFY